MNYTIAESKLKDLGYTFQKLYAANYKTYRKEIQGVTIWLWSKGKTIEINDWHEATDTILEFYKKHKDEPHTSRAMKIMLNTETNEVRHFDNEAYFDVFKTHSWDAWEAKYGKEWRTEIYLFYDKMDEIFQEIEMLTK